MIWLGAVGVVLLGIAAAPYAICLVLISVLDIGRPTGEKAPYEPTVSIVLPTYNEEAIVEKRLENLLAQDYPTDKLEVIVVDSGDDGTADLARNVLERTGSCDYLVIEEASRRGVAAAVNVAIERATGELVFRTDCDSLIDENAIREAAGNFHDPSIGAVTGRQAEVLGGSVVEQDYRDLQTKLQLLESRLDSTFIVHGPCFMFRRSLFRSLPHDSLADDTEIAVNVRRQGYRVVLDPAVRFTESGTSRFRARRRRKDRRAMGLLDLLARNRNLVGTNGLYGSFVLPMNGWMMWISPWLAAIGLLCVFAGLLPFGPLALCVPLTIAIGGLLGQYEALGPLQPLHALSDSMVSLLVASIRLREEHDGLWELDRTSREVFDP